MGTWAKYQQWWEKNREIVLEKRRQRYLNDGEYREKMKENVRKRRKKMYEKKVEECPSINVFLRPRRPVTVSLNGSQVVMYGVGMLAARLGKLSSTIVGWEKKGFIPETPFRDKNNNMRLYTNEMIEVVEKAYKNNVRNTNIVNKTAFYDEIKKGWEELQIYLDKKVNLDIIYMNK